jgi:hypothetical protein
LRAAVERDRDQPCAWRQPLAIVADLFEAFDDPHPRTASQEVLLRQPSFEELRGWDGVCGGLRGALGRCLLRRVRVML